MKHKIIRILLFFCLLAPIAATFTYLQYRRQQVRKEVKHQIIAGIDRAELVLLKFTEKQSQTELEWKHSKEFEYEGQMYDIVEYETLGDTTYYWCWEDVAETTLNKKLDDLTAYALGKNPQDQENQRRLLSFFKSLYFPAGSNLEFPIPGDTNKINPSYTEIYQSLCFSPADPPPKQ